MLVGRSDKHWEWCRPAHLSPRVQHRNKESCEQGAAEVSKPSGRQAEKVIRANQAEQQMVQVYPLPQSYFQTEKDQAIGNTDETRGLQFLNL